MSKSKKSISEKVVKELPELISEVGSMSAEECKTKLAALAQESAEIERAMEGDEALQRAKADAAEYAAPYKESLKLARLRIRYICSVLEERGKG